MTLCSSCRAAPRSFKDDSRLECEACASLRGEEYLNYVRKYCNEPYEDLKDRVKDMSVQDLAELMYCTFKYESPHVFKTLNYFIPAEKRLDVVALYSKLIEN